MLEQVDSHGLRRHLVVPDGLKGAAVGGVDQQNDQRNTDNRHKEGDKRTQPQNHLPRPVFDIEIGEGGEALDHVCAVGDGAEGLPLENRPENFGKPQCGNGEVITFQPQNRQTDQRREQRGHQPRQNQSYENGQHQRQSAAEPGASQKALEAVHQGELHSRAAVEVINLILGSHGNGENGVGIRAQQHEARLSQREQAGEAVEQVHGNGHQRIHRTLFQHGKQLTGGKKDRRQSRDVVAEVFQQDDQQQQHRNGDQRGKAAVFVCFLFQHIRHLLKPYPWPFRQRVRWACRSG